ncbi:MAG: hypothetical protein JST00_31800 [Deltaproteobacteria bacterium]|nr:hypothetical protein [Deltaproteobacteria bacterium]
MKARPELLFSVLALVAACHPPSQGSTSAPPPPPIVVRPVAAEPNAPPPAIEHPSTLEWTTGLRHLDVPSCKEVFHVPIVSRPARLATSVAAWVEEELASAGSLVMGATGCLPAEKRPPVAVRRVRGFVVVSFLVPQPLDAKYVTPPHRTFSYRTGKPFARVVAEKERYRLFERLRPRYRATMDRWLREPDVSPDCQAARDQYAPAPDDFAITERGFVFSGWTSLPMWARACLPQDEPIVSIEEVEPFLEPDALAAWRDE